MKKSAVLLIIACLSLVACEPADLRSSYKKTDTAASKDAPKLDVAVKDANDMELGSVADEPLDVRPTTTGHDTATQARAEAANDLPDIPVAKSEPVTGGQYIQVGSFSSLAAAQAAFSQLSQKADLTGLSPQFQTVTRADGQVLTRLKIGPVADKATAQILCQNLGISESWCFKS